MTLPKPISKAEDEFINSKFLHLVNVWNNNKTEDRIAVENAFRIAYDAHKNMRRKSGEPFIIHPIEVATIGVEEIGLGRTSIISALLHDTVEDTDLELSDIEAEFGSEISTIIDGLTKVDYKVSEASTAQAETVKKIILSLDTDVRIALIKLADRLHNMRTLESMPEHKQLRVISETIEFYAPMAYILGLFEIKTELEDLSFKYNRPNIYKEIQTKIDESSKKHLANFNKIKKNIALALQNINYPSEIILNSRTPSTIWNKINNKHISFEEADNYSIDIIIDVDPIKENSICWAAYGVITERHISNTAFLKDKISSPNNNGYKAIHASILVLGKWVKVHIRSKRMDEIAKKGFAADWKYKSTYNYTSVFEALTTKIKDYFNITSDISTARFNDTVKEELLTEGINVFTPTGKKISLPHNSTVLDFAYSIHSDLGNYYAASFINDNVQEIGYILKNGDRVKILTAKEPNVSESWFKYVNTETSKTKINAYLRSVRRVHQEEGEKKLQEYFSTLNIDYSKNNVALLMESESIKTRIDLFYFIAKDKLKFKDIQDTMIPKQSMFTRMRSSFSNPFSKPKSKVIDNPPESYVKPKIEIDKNGYVSNFKDLDYDLSDCCTVVPGEEIIGFNFPNKPIEVHSIDCTEVNKRMARYGKNIVKAKLTEKKGITFLVGINILATDSVGLIYKITKIISKELNFNIRSINHKSSQDIANMDITIYISSIKDLKIIMTKLNELDSVIKITRLKKI